MTKKYSLLQLLFILPLTTSSLVTGMDKNFPPLSTQPSIQHQETFDTIINEMQEQQARLTHSRLFADVVKNINNKKFNLNKKNYITLVKDICEINSTQENNDPIEFITFDEEIIDVQITTQPTNFHQPDLIEHTDVNNINETNASLVREVFEDYSTQAATYKTEEYICFTVEELAEQTTQQNPLYVSKISQSVILPEAAKKGLGWLETLAYYTTPTTKHIISYLSNKTFDTTNKDHLDILDKAINVAIRSNDFDTLAQIAALTNEHYKNDIRINQSLANSTFEFSTAKYTTELNSITKKLHDLNEQINSEHTKNEMLLYTTITNLITAHKNKTEAAIGAYVTLKEKNNNNLATLQKQISHINYFNRTTREQTTQLFINKNTPLPDTTLETNHALSTQSLNKILKITAPKIDTNETYTHLQLSDK